MKVGVILVSIFLAMSSYAGTKVAFTEARASNFPEQGTATNRKIIGGLSGTCSGTPSEDSVCNSCQDVAFTTLTTAETGIPCNEQRIHDNLKLQFTITTDTSTLVGGKLAVFYKNSSGTKENLYTLNDPVVASKTPATLEFKWLEICKKIDTDATSCDSVADGKSLEISVGIIKSGESSLAESVSYDVIFQKLGSDDKFHPDCFADTSQVGGFCQFEILAGDEKVQLSELNENVAIKTKGDRNIAAIRLFHKEIPAVYCDMPRTKSGADYLSEMVNTGSPLPYSNSSLNKDITIEEDGSISIKDTDLFAKGLENGKCYGFVLASEDEAKNVGYFTPDSFLSNYYTQKNIVGRPNKVTGLLDEDDNCAFVFLFGTSHPITQAMRLFRDRVLRPLAPGRSIIRAYYKLSPGFISIANTYNLFLLLLLLASGQLLITWRQIDRLN